MSSSSEMKSTLENVLIPFEEINFATNGFEKKNQMGDSGFGPVYKGQLSERWGNRIAAIKRHDSNSYQGKQEFETELQIVSSLHHPNVISFIGYCDESKEMITVYEYAINGSLDHHLEDINRRSSLTWVQRLIICLGAARGIEYLHSGPGDHNRVIQSIFSSADILLDKNLEAKICNFGLSRSSPSNQQHTSKTSCYLDPLYRQRGVITKESHIYSFGVVLFELLSGMLAYNKKKVGDDMPQTLILSVRRNWQGGLEKIIDPLISDQIDSRSLNTFKKVAYRCISFNLEDRPTMDRVIKKLEKALALQVPLLNYVIPLEEIILATNNFHENSRIGEGGFGKVYKGQLSQRWENRTAAIKCLRPECLQGKEGFEKELTMVSRFHHQNIIPFIGYCDEGDKMIMVYEYATNGCLDDHIRDPNKRSSITWGQRLKICLGAARGLEYLHSGLGDHNRVIHRDVKSANILLDDNMEAKICDFGLSRAAPRNQPHTQVHTKVAGTSFYCDPIYSDSGILTKEADIYSLGVVMFEMLSGLLAYGTRSIGGDKALPLINLVRQYENVGQENIIDPYISDQINSHSLDTFKRVAYKCISFTLKDRPTMDSIIENIEKALHFQENIDIGQQYDTDDNLDPQHDTDEDFDLQYDS